MKILFKSFLFFIFHILLIGIVYPAPGDFVKDVKLKELIFEIPTVTKEELIPGVAYYGDSRGEFPIVYLDINFYTGIKRSDITVEIPALLADTLKFGGSKKNPDESLVSKIEALGGNVNILSSPDKITLKVSFLSRDQNEILALLEELLKEPAFTEKAFLNAKKKIAEGIKRRNERTESLGFRKMKEVLFRNYTRGIPYSIERLEKIQATELLSFYQDMYRVKKKSIVVSGKFDENKMKDWLRNTIPASNSDDPGHELIELEKLKTDFKDDPRKEIFIEKKVNQSMLMYSGIVPEHGHPDYYAIQLLNYIIGGGGFNSMMMQKIRVDKGLAYSAASYPVVDATYGIIYFYTLTKNESLKEAHDILKEILSARTFDAITEEDLKVAKDAILNQFVFLFTNKHTILENQLELDEDRLPENYLNTYRDKMNSVTLSDIKRVGKEMFAEEKLKFLIVSSKENIEKFYGTKKVYQPEDSVKE